MGPPPPGAARELGVFLAFCCHVPVYAPQWALSMVVVIAGSECLFTRACVGRFLGVHLAGCSAVRRPLLPLRTVLLNGLRVGLNRWRGLASYPCRVQSWDGRSGSTGRRTTRTGDATRCSGRRISRSSKTSGTRRIGRSSKSGRNASGNARKHEISKVILLEQNRWGCPQPVGLTNGEPSGFAAA